MTADEWGIPTLDIGRRARARDLPDRWRAWGETGRSRRLDGMGVHFFRWDHVFSALMKRPEALPELGPKVAVEPNFSTHPGMSRAEVLWGMQRKRSMASIWQKFGVPVLVDLNVDHAFRDLGLLGVPAGWTSYATRCHAEMTEDDLEADFLWAASHAGTEALLMVVFGGGVRIRGYCEERGWHWSPARSPWRKRGTDG